MSCNTRGRLELLLITQCLQKSSFSQVNDLPGVISPGTNLAQGPGVRETMAAKSAGTKGSENGYFSTPTRSASN